jgi:hypothetical protein
MPKRRAYPSVRSLKPGQATEIKRLRLRYKFGATRIALLMGLSEGVVRSVIRGNSYVDETGGAVVLRDKESTRWKHGRKSYREVLCE